MHSGGEEWPVSIEAEAGCRSTLSWFDERVTGTVVSENRDLSLNENVSRSTTNGFRSLAMQPGKTNTSEIPI